MTRTSKLSGSDVSSGIDFSPPSGGTFRLTASGPLGRTYIARLARSREEVRAAQALRFQVFNLELHKGLAHSFSTGLDADHFDQVCDHLIVEEVSSGELVGTPLDSPNETSPEVPRLLAACLALGAAICGPPAMDRQFGTIDFLTVLDLQKLPPRVAGRYLNSLPDFARTLLEAV